MNMTSGNEHTENEENDEPKVLMSVDEIRKSQQHLKPRDKYYLAVVIIPYMVVGYVVLSPTFTLYVPAQRCCDAGIKTMESTTIGRTNASVSSFALQQFNDSNISSTRTSYDDQCLRPKAIAHNDSLSPEKCSLCWEFDKSELKTLASEFKLVCSSSWKRPLLTCLFMIGILFGSMMGGYLSDRFGRQVVLRVSYLLLAICLFFLSYTTSYVSYAMVLTGVGFFEAFIYLTAFVLAQELMPETKVYIAVLIIFSSFGLGFLVLPLAAYLIRNWRWLIRVAGIAALAHVPFFWWLTPESPAWIEQNSVNKSDVKEVKLIPSSLRRQREYEMEKSITTSVICSNPVLRKRIWISCFLWNISLLAYYTLNLNSSNLGGNIYINCAIAALVDIASSVTMAFVLNRIGRRALCMTCFLLTGIFCLLTPLMRSVHVAAGIASSMTGKLFDTITVGLLVLYTGEMFPTLLRSTSVGISSMSSRLLSAAAPFLVFTGEAVNLSIPYYVMGTLALIAAGLTLLLPETSNSVLPDTVQDSVDLDKKFQCRELISI